MKLIPCLVAAGVLASAGLSIAAPPPPPSPAEEQELQNFLRALPKRIPADVDRFERSVSPNVKVYRDGKLAFSDRNAWLGFLRSYAPKTSDEPQGTSVSREAFYRLADGGIGVLEFSNPIPPAGREGQIAYHPEYPFQLVTYYLRQGRLVRVDYGRPMRRLQ